VKDANAEEVVVLALAEDAKLGVTVNNRESDLEGCKDAKSKLIKMFESAITPLNSSFKLIESKQHAYSFRSTKKVTPWELPT
jgi:hypothetical protein